MYLGKKIIAVIPARGGSKGIKNKNMSKIGGISLIGHTSIFLNKLNFIDKKIISTDKQSYINEAKRYGIKDSVKRSRKLSDDKASVINVLLHVVKNIEDSKNLFYDYLLLLEPTCPLRKEKEIKDSLKLAITKQADSVISVSKLDIKYHPFKIFNLKNNKIKYYSKVGNKIFNKQQIKNELYFRNGIIYVISIPSLKKNKKIITNNTVPFVVDRNISNIDTKNELLWTEFLYQNEN